MKLQPRNYSPSYDILHISTKDIARWHTSEIMRRAHVEMIKELYPELICLTVQDIEKYKKKDNKVIAGTCN